MKHLIYSVEDDENIAYIINKTLTNVGYLVKSFGNSDELFKALEESIPSVILLDIMLPKLSGLEILEKIKENPYYKEIIIIIISAKDDEIDKVQGLDLGADDYIAKPFGILELTSRINAHIRRLDKRDTVYTCQDIILNIDEHTCYRGSELINLTIKEFDLLKVLLENKNKVVSREDLLNIVWGYDFVGETRTLDVHIKTLRQKLGDCKENRIIESVRSVGYKIVE